MVFLNLFSKLFARARSGDRAAQAQFRKELERAMVHFVIRTLHGGGADSLIARQILAKARRVHQVFPAEASVTQEDFVRAVARGVCDDMLGQLQSRVDVCAETVCDTANAVKGL